MFHATTEFSLGQSLLSIDDIAKTVEVNNLPYAVVCDNMNVSAMIPLSEKLGDKLITGVRFTLVDDAEQKRQQIFQPKVYAKTEVGMQILYRYITKSFDRPYFFEMARLDFATFASMLAEGGKEHLLVSTGDFNSVLTHPKHGFFISAWLSNVDVVVDICPVKTARWDRVNYTGLKLAEELSLPVCPYIPAIYLPKDAELFPIHYSIHKNVEFNFLNPYFEKYYVHSSSMLIAALKETFGRIEKRYNQTFKPRRYVFDPADFYKWKKAKPLLPQLSATPLETLKKLTIEGFKKRLFNPLYGYTPAKEQVMTEYADRLKHEFKVLGDLGFSDYFLLVYELINWCQGQDIKVGPGRGSVGGSLIAFCLGITDVDPVRFGLLFERFINPTRLDLPDIDLDFQTSRRGEIIEHLYDRYGKENVAGIINYASLQASSALRSTCRILGLDEQEYACSKLVPKNFGKSLKLTEAAEQVIDIKNFSINYPEYWDKATRLEKKLRNFSTHAAGVIVSSRPIVTDAVIETRKNAQGVESRVINWDKKICEKQGLIKLDILGLTNLDIIDLCVQYIRDRHGVSVVLSDIPLDDYKTLEQFALGNTGGVFQFEGGSVRKLLKGLAKGGNITFDDLVAANALNRPGPIEAGLVQAYVDGKNGSLHDAFHPSIADIVEPTFNVICYQEQIMAASVAFAGYTLPEADNLRKLMGKKDDEGMALEKDKFIEGAFNTNGIDHATSNELFEQISKFAFYAFNKSHSVEYSLLGYICMWLKTYYPTEFYAASLTYIDDKKVRSIITEAKKNGINVDAPSINHSTDKFMPVDAKRIVAPLSKVKYVQGAAKHIMEARGDVPFKSVEDLQERVERRLCNSRVIGALKAIGAMDEIDPESASYDPVERSKAINEYLPSLPLGYVQIDRKIDLTEGKGGLGGLLADLKKDDANFVMPFLGSTPKFMVVSDSANKTEAREGKFAEGKQFGSIQRCLYRAELNKSDGYYTGLVKRQKLGKEKVFSNDVLDASFKILKEEIDIIKPPVIVCLGSAVSRMFVPTLKGSATDNALQVHYNPELDANIVLGFSPGMMHFNPDLEETLQELFDLVASMVN